MKFLRYLRLLLFPVSVVYGFVMSVRNVFYRYGVFSSEEFDIPVISIGNISVGGTGKTPHTEYLISILKDTKQIAVLSRGYKRSTTGFVEVLEGSKAYVSGDEPLQMKRKFPDVRVVVDEDRRHGIRKLLAGSDAPELILLDDAYQHRSVRPRLNILLIDFHRPIKKDLVLPAGDLREFSRGRKRADIIFITKCPNLFEHEVESWRKKYCADHQHLYFSNFEYRNLTPVFAEGATLTTEQLLDYEVLLVTGIANPRSIEKYVGKKCLKITAMHFPDHHLFTEKDIVSILNKYSEIKNNKKVLITTEKDAVRLKDFSTLQNKLRNNLFYLPISVRILFGNEDDLKKTIQDYVRKD